MRRPTDGPAWIALAAALAATSACGPAGTRDAATPPSPATKAELERPLPSPLPDVVALVNGAPIRLAQLVPAAKAELRRQSPAGPEQHKAEALRRALEQYVERELLLQEAIARGVRAEDRQVQWAYDQLRREYADDAAWTTFLAGEGLEPQALRSELRVQQTVAALVQQEAKARGVSPDEARSALVAKLRAAARIELFL